MEKNPLSFFNSILAYIDGGQFFRNPVKWLYMIIAALNVLTPFFVLFTIIDSGQLSLLPAKGIFALVLIWLVLLAGFCLLGLLWWLRKDLLGVFDENNSEFPVTPIFAHIIRTAGEWLGLLVGAIFPVALLIALIFLGSDSAYPTSQLPGGGGWASLIILPITGFLMIVFSRFLSEQVKVFVTIARNTKK